MTDQEKLREEAHDLETEQLRAAEKEAGELAELGWD